MAADKAVSNYEEVFEEEDAPKEAQTVHRIRANSTIMHLNKILGEYAPSPRL
jgi:pyruvate carboxylase